MDSIGTKIIQVRIINFEIKRIIENDGKWDLIPIKAMTAKHSPLIEWPERS